MSKKRVISEEVFAAMLDQAIEDLKQSGLDAGEVFSIVEENFGISYARRFCSQWFTARKRPAGEGHPMPSSPATLEIFTDCTCPWCYFMSGRIARLKKEYAIQIRRRAFPFHSDIPEDGVSLAAFFSDDPFIIQERMRNLKETAKGLGLSFGSPKMIYNSRSAQELCLWAESKDKGDAFLQALYKAYFVVGKNIAKIPSKILIL